MPGLVAVPEVPRYVPAQLTTETLDYADLPVIDLSKARSTPEAFQELAGEVGSAMSAQGFLYVINHGYTPPQACHSDGSVVTILTKCMDRFRRSAFSTLPTFHSHYQKMRRSFMMPNRLKQDPSKASNLGNTGISKEESETNWSSTTVACHHTLDIGLGTEIMLVNKNVSRRNHPEAIRPFLPEVEAFSRHNHFNVVQPILRLLATGLELPENTLVDMHDFSSNGESHVRFMKYYPRSEDDEIKSQNLWLKGHTDIGSITLLYSQPVMALQILGVDGKWKWVKHIENAIIVNIGDALEFLSGGYYKATIHRVVQPPADQRTVARLGIGYFTILDHHVKLAPLTDSPVLQRVGIQRRFESDDNAPTMEEWRKGRSLAYGHPKTVWKTGEQQGEAKVDEEIINGIVLKHYK
ncbi:Clavaminate synthase-like protein [Moniliophthora roreri MCA 2997]|uniref:Clavaminate synthase-like protein n=1 Tax=Moniliophthora roreri (strain MCA 2997) TaxID=1381753 RepID=V2WXS6_MONRO|nr:Clavaminate synthase-like protein [Moniliophthora roreri MCA 2997]